MAYLQDLIPSMAYDRWDYVRALRALLPRGLLWNIPLPDEQDIRLNSILSSEEFGRVTLFSGIVYITPNGIISSEGFGLPVVFIDQSLSIFSIVSLESWGSPAIITGNVNVAPNGIVSGEAFGLLTLIRQWIQYCTFEIDLGSGWDSAFQNNWYQTVNAGEGIAQSAIQRVDRLYPPTGQMLTGDFLVEWGFWRYQNEGTGNESIHMEVWDSSASITTIELYQGMIYGNAGSFPMATGPVEQRMRTERVGSTIWNYRWYSGAWQREDSWPTTQGSYKTNSNPIYFKVDGADAVNGFSYIAINGTLV